MSSTQAADIESTAVKKEVAPKKCGTKQILIGLLIFVACAGGAVGGILGGLSKPAIVGVWESNFGSYYTVTEKTMYSVTPWSTGVSPINEITGSYMIMQNPADAAYYPSKWVKTEFHASTAWAPDGVGFCSTVYDADTKADAVAKDTSAIYDTADAKTGCNGFPHTELKPYALPFAGSWTTNWDEAITISGTEWSAVSGDTTTTYRVEAYGVRNPSDPKSHHFMLMQNAADAAYNPSKWTLVEYHKDGAKFGYCMSVYDGASAKAALTKDTSSIYDKADATAGCNGFGHTIATKA